MDQPSRARRFSDRHDITVDDGRRTSKCGMMGTYQRGHRASYSFLQRDSEEPAGSQRQTERGDGETDIRWHERSIEQAQRGRPNSDI